MEEVSPDRIQGYIDQIVGLGIEWGPRLLLALVVLVVGLWIINRVVAMFRKGMEAREVEPSLAGFVESLSSILFKALLLVSVASMVGIETTSFIAILGAAGLAVGLALQGSLANFAGGVLILVFKPYKVGDFIDAQGVAGTVKGIQIFNTIITTPDNKQVIVPNGAISNGIITNVSAEATRRVDFVFGIGYGDDIASARAEIASVIGAEDRVLDDPEPLVVVSELADSSVNFTVRVWVNAADYWGVFFDLTEAVKLRFDERGISIPFPQSDIHVYQHVAEALDDPITVRSGAND